MGNNRYSRRKFFRSLTAADAPETNDDPLFKKYSRKKGGSRRYSTQLAEQKIGTEDTDSSNERVGAPVTSGLAPYTGTWEEWQVLHLLRRTNFGFKKPWVDSLMAMTPSAAVDAVLNISPTPPAPPVNWYENVRDSNNNYIYRDESALTGNNNATDNPIIGYGADWTNHYFPANAATAYTGQTTNYRRMDSLRRWLFGLTLNGDVTIREKMVWFWFHFIPIDFDVISESSNSYVNTNSSRIFYRYFKLFRDNVLGNFKALMKEVSLSPAMMFYLNGQASAIPVPDENYAREVMELFTLGKEPLRYTEDDVKAAARALTGWRVGGMNTATVTTTMNTANTTSNRKHDNGEKVFSSNFGTNVKIAASTNPATWAGELDQLLDIVFGAAQKEYVSRYICRRLYRFFVYYDIDANIEANVIVPLAQTFVAANWNIKPVLEQLLKSQHFFDMANRGAYIKSPFDLVAGTLNAFNVNTTHADIEQQYRIWSRYNDTTCNGMEQRMGSIPNVAGWNPFYQAPAYHQYWINSNTIQKRFLFLKEMINLHTIGSVYTTGTTARKFGIDTIAWAAQFGNTIAAEPNALVATTIKYLLPVDISLAQRNAIKGRTLLYQQTTDSYWTTAWNNMLSTATTAAAPNATAAQITAATNARNIVEAGMKRLLYEICQLAEYQLM